MAIERAEVTFASGEAHCAAWLYRPAAERATARATCVVMAHGFADRHDGLAPYAERLAQAGAAALVFDDRYLGDSGGEPRQRFREREQLADWRAAVSHARLDGVDPERIVLWGFSLSGGHAVQTAAADPRIAATLAVCPMVDGLARALATPPAVSAWLTPRSLADQLGRHNLVAVTGQPGEHAAMTLPGEADGFRASVPEGSPWRNEISPGVFLTVACTVRCSVRADCARRCGSAWASATCRSPSALANGSPLVRRRASCIGTRMTTWGVHRRRAAARRCRPG